MSQKTFFYYHSESDSVWKSHTHPSIVLKESLDVDEVDEQRANELAEELELDYIPLIKD